MGKPGKSRETIDRTPEDASGGEQASDEGGNPAATPGSVEGGTLAGTPGYLSGGTMGSEPATPQRIPPWGEIDTTPEGASEEGLTGTTTGGRSGSTAASRVGSSTDYLRELSPQDLPHEEEHPHEHPER